MQSEVFERLTPREREVVSLVLEGNFNHVIAKKLCISIKTVDAHKANIYKKLDVHSSTQLTILVYKNEQSMQTL